MEAKKAGRNGGGNRSNGPGHTPMKVGLAKSRLLGRLTGIEVVDEDDEIMENLVHRERKGGSI